MSLKPLSEIEEILNRFKNEPHKRLAQKELAREMTLLIHGKEEFDRAFKATRALFVGELKSLDKKTLLDVFRDSPSVHVKKEEILEKNLVDLLVHTGLCSSKSQARKDIQSGAIYVNDARVTKGDLKINWESMEKPTSQAREDRKTELKKTLEKNEDPEKTRDQGLSLLFGSFLILRRGKKNYLLVQFE